jgi:hypothetical protein
MQANIPPDSLPIVNGARFDKRLDIGIEISPGREYFWYSAILLGDGLNLFRPVL